MEVEIHGFGCEICGKQFIREQNLEKHKISVHSPLKKKFVCPQWPQCRKVKNTNGLYSTMANLRVHFIKHHKKKTLDPAKVQTSYLQSKFPISNNI